MQLKNAVITSVLGVFTIPTSKDRFLKIVNRPSYALSFCTDDGVIVYNNDGKKTVSDKNRAVILPQGQNYTLYNEEGGNFPIINFLTEKPITEEFLEIKIKNPQVYISSFEKMRALWLSGNDQAKLFSILYYMLSRLCDENAPTTPVLSGSINFIYENIENPLLTNTLLAQRAKVSEVYFRRLFKEEYGTTPKQYILNLRIENAKKLLSEGISSIAKISESCGFSSVYHFSRAFKLATGYTPSEYSRKS